MTPGTSRRVLAASDIRQDTTSHRGAVDASQAGARVRRRTQPWKERLSRASAGADRACRPCHFHLPPSPAPPSWYFVFWRRDLQILVALVLVPRPLHESEVTLLVLRMCLMQIVPTSSGRSVYWSLALASGKLRASLSRPTTTLDGPAGATAANHQKRWAQEHCSGGSCLAGGQTSSCFSRESIWHVHDRRALGTLPRLSWDQEVHYECRAGFLRCARNSCSIQPNSREKPAGALTARGEVP